MSDLWSYILTAVGLAGFFLAGKKVWWAWYVNIANQILWFAYSWVTEQWGFLIGTFFYMAVFVKNAYQWTCDHYDIKYENWRHVKRDQSQEFLDEFDLDRNRIAMPWDSEKRPPADMELRHVAGLVPYCGNLNQSMEYPYRCTRDAGHDYPDNPPEERRHGYAGVFW